MDYLTQWPNRKRFEEEMVYKMTEADKRKTKISIASSIGISLYPDHGQTTEELLLKADHAMYDAKQKI